MHPILDGALRQAMLLGRAWVQPASVGASAFVVSAGKIALVRQSYANGWHFPGGGVDPGEAPAHAALREAREEIGLTECHPPTLFAVYTRKVGMVTNLVLLYRLDAAQVAFKPNWEIRALRWIDPNDPPSDLGKAVLRRLAEYRGETSPSPYW